ncbi:DUF1826 domain-containing protein [Psychrobium sp. MM17-31]|uniref:DUF1826 domain-containing protein n=1 Tax=Psychrobium sp. MM17-31 TaxID=2917758 RepID=UPI001EF4865C|nr:DUF1826 domain-containing protein [Psychrobium sp. MM17-31]
MNNLAESIPTRIPSISDEPSVLADIYQASVNISVWQRDLSEELNHEIHDFITNHPKASASLAMTPDNAIEVLSKDFETKNMGAELHQDIAQLVDMFCCLFEQKRAGVRLTVLDRAMCPRFHVDRIPCRLVTTYNGIATQWLNHDDVNRDKLGAKSQGLPDEDSGLISADTTINQLTTGDVALLKGEYWSEEEGFGLVHRSPAVAAGEKRLLLTIDFIDD